MIISIKRENFHGHNILKMIKVAFIGTGYMGQEHLKAFSSLKNINIVGILNKTTTRSVEVAKKFNLGFIAKNIKDLFELAKPDIVIIAVPELNLKDVCLKAFNYNSTFLIEKPIGYNLKEAIFLKKLATKNKRKVYIGLNRRYFQSTKLALKELKKDNSKRIINIFDQQSILESIKNGIPKLVANNFMYANSIHLIDYAKIFCRGKIINVENVCDWKKNKKTLVVSKIKFSSGDIAIYQAIWNGPGPWVVSINTSKKRLEMKPLENLTLQKKGSRNIIKVNQNNSIDEEFKPGVMMQAKDLIKSFRNKQTKLPTIKDGLDTMKLIHKIYDL